MTDAQVAALAVKALVTPPTPENRVAAQNTQMLLQGASGVPVRVAAQYTQALFGTAVVSGSEPPVSWWDGSALQSAAAQGWWDGAAIQSMTTEGWWDGAAIQPLAAAAAPPAFRAAASTPFNGTDASSQAITIPSTVQVGDVLILGAVSNSAGPPSTPAGWTAIDTWTGSFSHHKLLYRVAQAGDAGSTVTVTLGSAGRLSLGMSCYSGALAPSGFARTAETSGTTVTHPSVSAVSPIARLVCGMSLYTSSVSSTETVGSPLTSRIAQACVWTHVAIGDQPLSAAGATGTRTSSVVQTGTEFAWSLLLEPA